MSKDNSDTVKLRSLQLLRERRDLGPVCEGEALVDPVSRSLRLNLIKKLAADGIESQIVPANWFVASLDDFLVYRKR